MLQSARSPRSAATTRTPVAGPVVAHGSVLLDPAAPGGAFSVSAVAISSGITQVSVAGGLIGDVRAGKLAALLWQERKTGCRFVRLDLARSPMLDRVGLDALLEAHEWFLAAGGVLALTGVTPRIARLLEITGFGRTLYTIAHPRDLPTAEPDRAAFDRAVGVVIARARCDVAEATEHVLMLARATNRTLVEVARSLLDEPAKARAHLRCPRPSTLSAAEGSDHGSTG